MLSPNELRRGSRDCEEKRVVRVEPPSGELNRQMYVYVGGGYGWTDRLTWSDADWQAYAERPEIETWAANVQGAPAGYFELALQPRSREVEIAYFGLLPAYIGRGLGGVLLHAALERAWQITDTRVWVHTCTLDSPCALPNYLARGMKVYKTEVRAAAP